MTQAPSVQQAQLFDMPSGARLSVTVAPFQDAWALMRASLKTLQGTSIETKDLKTDLASVVANPAAFSFILDRLVGFATSPEVEAAIWRCATRALYIPAGSPVEFPGNKVSPALFDDAVCGNSAREDYAQIVISLMEANCKPFLAQALLKFQKQKTVETSKNPQ